MPSASYVVDGVRWTSIAVPLPWKSCEIWERLVADELRQEFRDWRLPREGEEECP